MAIWKKKSDTGSIDPDRKILNFGRAGIDWTLEDAFSGTQIFGATGSGKTSGSGHHLIRHFLQSGMGGLVLTVKPSEADDWLRYAAEAGRPKSDLILFGPEVTPTRPYRFNFLEYENEHAKTDTRFIENVVNVISEVMELEQRSNDSGNGNSFWRNAARQMVRNSVALVRLSGEDVTFRNIYRVCVSAPESASEAKELVGGKEGQSYCIDLIKKMGEQEKEGTEIPDADIILYYWLEDFAKLAQETRSSIVSHFSTVADLFVRGTLRDLFSSPKGDHELRPELCRGNKGENGKIIVLDLPVKDFKRIGQLSQVLYKLTWQSAMERSKGEKRPCFLYVDEAQFFITPTDMMFQSTARSSRVATVYLSQNISNYYAVMPGDRGRAETDSLMGNLQLQVFHANTDTNTNQWASELIGRSYQEVSSSSINVQTGAREASGHGTGARQPADSSATSAGRSTREELRYEVLPREFGGLKKGGKKNGLVVEGIAFFGGVSAWEKMNFRQKDLPDPEPEDPPIEEE